MNCEAASCRRLWRGRSPRRHTRASGYPVRRGPSIDHRLLYNTGSPAFAGDDIERDILDRLPSRAMTRRVTFACAPMRKQAAFVVGPRRHTRESGYPVRRGPSINHQLLCNTGSPAFAGDDTLHELRGSELPSAMARSFAPASYPRKRVSSTPRPVDQSPAPLQYWIARLRRR